MLVELGVESSIPIVADCQGVELLLHLNVVLHDLLQRLFSLTHVALHSDVALDLRQISLLIDC